VAKGFVHIVESPSAQDLLDGRTEGRSLSEAMRLAEIPHCYSLASNLLMFQQALGQRLRMAIDHYKAIPILHFSAHGNSEGIGLTSGEFLPWSELDKLLQPIHEFFRGGLLICLSSCESAQGMRMAMTNGPERPFWALVSHMGRPNWSDCAVAYTVFYNRFFKDHGIEAAVEAMRAATGDPNFAMWFGQQVKQNWLDTARQALADALQEPSASGGGLLSGWPAPADRS
jgi:hypothetical protein